MIVAGQTPIEHRLPGDRPGIIRAIEYPLPCSLMPPQTATVLHGWIRAFIGMEVPGARVRLETRWANIAQPGLRHLADYLLSFAPSSVIVRNSCSWLVLKDPAKAVIENVGDQWFIAPPPDSDFLEHRLKAFGLETHDLVRDFTLCFGGLREDIPNLSGEFVAVQAWEPFAGPELKYIRETCRNFNDWEGSLVFYQSRNGDQLLLHPYGNVGWWSHESDEVYDLLGSFDAFPEYCCRYIKHRYPFSSWEPPASD